jgi:type I restriction enzyme R subunit
VKEEVVEQAALGWFEWLGYNPLKGVDISPGVASPLRSSYTDVLLLPQLQSALRRINDNLPEDIIEQVTKLIARPREISMTHNNRWFHNLLIDGVDVEYRTPEGDIRGDKAWLIDFENPTRNDFVIVSQLTVKYGNDTRRPDLVVYVNGLPLIVIELKGPTDESADIWKAYRQLQNYKSTVPSLFYYNELMVVSDGEVTRVGSLTAEADRFTPWRSIEDPWHPGRPQLEVLIKGLFEPVRLLDYLRNCIVFDEDVQTGKIEKKCAAYHQFRAVRNARDSVKLALRPGGDGRGGVIWHTQGSGKSLTMLMLSGALVTDRELANPTIIVVTDRNDLDDQLFRTFSGGRGLLRQDPVQALSREDLKSKLNRASGGVIFTTIQKFAERRDPVSERSNIVVLADEAHRSQYSFVEGGARWMRDSVPNATFIGFTGTPLELDDRSTPAVFGHYADVYDVRQAIDDGATVPIYYEMRLVNLVPDEVGIAEAELRLEALAVADNEGYPVPADIEVPLEELVGARERLKVVAREVVGHFEKRREVIEGKGMVVCMSRGICMDLYDEIVRLRPLWHAPEDDEGFIKVIMTGSSAEGERVAEHSRSPARREVLARRFKDPEDNLRLVIVCNMWLTGFDCPPMHTMYLDRPLAGHNLMQAIARVNRVFGEKPGGVVVDFIGIADELRDAVETYSQSGGDGSPVESIQDEAVPLMEREYEALRDFFHEFDYGGFVGGTEAEQLYAVIGGVDHVFGQEDGRQRFVNMVASLSKAFALAVPREETDAIRDSLAYFQAVRAAIRKQLANENQAPAPDARSAVRQMISGAIAADGVIDIFKSIGFADRDVGILSEDFLERLASMPQRNLALETLRKLLNDQVAARERINIVQSRTFREALSAVLKQYANNAINTAQVIEELIGLARIIRDAVERGNESGLTQEEFAFYSALADNESAREVMQDDTLRVIARELTESVKARVSIDWAQRETVRADMRRTVRRLLTKYGYPPDAQETATQLVIRQAELMAQSPA